ncbi:MAG TPA: hypothetical protein VHY08_22215 [Bacillota bacterium]|nr:hypothetical protein [Bacillota bacterium]
MGYGIVRCKPVYIKPDEEIDFKPIYIPKEERAVIHGTILCPSGHPAKGAVVKLFRVKKHHEHGCDDDYPYKPDHDKPCDDDYDCRPCDLEPIGHQFTDDCGQFLFPIDVPNAKYVIKATMFKPQSRQVDCDC